MISNEMFGSDIIRVKINGYLKNKARFCVCTKKSIICQN